MDNRPIGVFDSGLGGLTVLKEIMKILPGESVVYFGDCGRIPYGTKSKQTVTKYTFQDIKFLLTHDVKMVVIACNTASAYSYAEAKNEFNIPLIEVVTPGAESAVGATRNRKVGIIGTPGTISSAAYEKAITGMDGGIQTFSAACPLFVPLVEEGWWDNEIARLVTEKYLESLKNCGADTLVLGCTHYPLLEKTISGVMGSEVNLVNSAMEAARAVKKLLTSTDMFRDSGLEPVYRYYTSDSVEKFEALGSTFLGKVIKWVEKVDIERY